jgi:hypothetical protein
MHSSAAVGIGSARRGKESTRSLATRAGSRCRLTSRPHCRQYCCLCALTEHREASSTLAGMAAEDRPRRVPLAASSPLPKSIYVELIGWRRPGGFANPTPGLEKQLRQNTRTRTDSLCCIPSPSQVCMIGASHQSMAAVGQRRGGRPLVRSGG